MKRSLILGLHVILQDISPLGNPGIVSRILLDPKVKLLLNEQPPLDLVQILSLDEASELLSGETHGTAKAYSLVSMGEPQGMIVFQASSLLSHLESGE